MSQLRNANVPGGLQSSNHPGQYARKDLHEARPLEPKVIPANEVLQAKGADIKNLVEAGNVIRVKASEAYARNLAQTIGARYPNVDRLYFNDSHDEVDGRTYSLSHVRMVEKGMEIPEELKHMGLSALDDYELNGTDLDDALSFDEEDVDYNHPFLSVGDYMDMGNEDDHVVVSYAQQLDDMVHLAQSQAAAARLCMTAREIRARFPDITGVTLGNDADGDGRIDLYRIDTVTLSSGTTLEREGVEGEHMDWEKLDEAMPASGDLSSLAGKELSVDELVGWHPGDSIS